MNTTASHQTRAVKKVLAALPVSVNTMRRFKDTAVKAAELETVTHARALLVAAGFSVSEVHNFSALGFHVYVTVKA